MIEYPGLTVSDLIQSYKVPPNRGGGIVTPFMQLLQSSMMLPSPDGGGTVAAHIPPGQAPRTVIVPLQKPFVDFQV